MTWWMDLRCVPRTVALELRRCLSATCWQWMDQSCFQRESAFLYSQTWVMDSCCVAHSVALDLCRWLSATRCHWWGQSCFQCAFAFFNFYGVGDGFLLRCGGSATGTVTVFVSSMLTLDGSELFPVCICFLICLTWWMHFCCVAQTAASDLRRCF